MITLAQLADKPKHSFNLLPDALKEQACQYPNLLVAKTAEALATPDDQRNDSQSKLVTVHNFLESMRHNCLATEVYGKTLDPFREELLAALSIFNVQSFGLDLDLTLNIDNTEQK